MSKLQNDTVVQDEIDLLELLQVLWKKKGLIILIAMLTVGVSMGYLFFHKPVYEAKIILGPPITSDLKAFNLRPAPVELLNTSDAYTTFRMTLFSDATMRAFKTSRDKELSHQLLQKEGAVSITLHPESLGRYAVLVRGANPKTAAEQAENFVRFSQKLAVNELNAAQMREVSATKLFLEKKIKLVQERAQKTRKEQLVRLYDALSIAEASKLEYPSAKMVGTDGNNSAHLRGSKALKAEIADLENHPNDLYKPELSTLKEQYDRWGHVEPVIDNVVLAKSYGDVIVSDNPVGFDAKRILLFSCFGGLFLGVMMVILLHIKQHLKKSRIIES